MRLRTGRQKAITLFLAMIPACLAHPQSSSASDVSICRDYGERITARLAEARPIRENIEAIARDLEARIAPFLACQQAERVYVPGHPLADGAGCLDTRTLQGPQGAQGSRGEPGRNITCFR
ncbi:hypothetical protein [Stappia sp. TSB10GB4]|uniref:hypothetical protein n=1 Tax=Stappia sp. TSB10GB4 TaxID=2003584 RepID=UPI00164882F4|nr:hypothetical protein [Stappia sp. TSB10GB4]